MDKNTMNTDQTATKGVGDILYGFIVFVIKATKVQKQMKEQITVVTNGGKWLTGFPQIIESKIP